MSLVSPIYNRAHGDAPEGAEAEARNHEVYRRLWQQYGKVVVDPDKIPEMDWPMREWALRYAEAQYGQRK